MAKKKAAKKKQSAKPVKKKSNARKKQISTSRAAGRTREEKKILFRKEETDSRGNYELFRDAKTGQIRSQRARKKKVVSKPPTLNKRQKTALKQANTKGFQLRDKKGHFISSKATKAILDKVKKSKSKTIDYKKFLDAPEVKGMIKMMVVVEPINVQSISTRIRISKADKKKINFIEIDGGKISTRSEKEAGLTINTNNSDLYDILEIIEENEGKVDSPHFNAIMTEKTSKDGMIVIWTFDYSHNNVSPSIKPEIWKEYKEFWISMNLRF